MKWNKKQIVVLRKRFFLFIVVDTYSWGFETWLPLVNRLSWKSSHAMLFKFGQICSRQNICTLPHIIKLCSKPCTLRGLVATKVGKIRSYSMCQSFAFKNGCGGGTVVRAFASLTNVAWVSFLRTRHYVGWVCWWFLSQYSERYGYSSFTLSSRTNITKIQ